MAGQLRKFIRIAVHCRFWHAGHGHYLWNQWHRPNGEPTWLLDDAAHLQSAADWLKTAQDVAGDGGFSGRYSLHRGWSTTYPETTGYIIPTFLRLAQHYRDQEYHERAGRAVECLLKLQLADGAFPGGEVAENTTEPSPFNSAQILHGLIAWYRVTEDERALHAAQRAGDWLASVQDDDGAFRQYFYHGVAASYASHLSCWVGELGALTGERRYFDVAERHLDWVLAQQESATGWFRHSGFDQQQFAAQQAFTHTIAYTIWGVLFSGQLLKRSDAISAARRAAEGVLGHLEHHGRLAGILDRQWDARVYPACLTGNAQMALIWQRLYELTGERRFIEGAGKAIDLIKACQDQDNPNPGIRGGIAGSYPVWGPYISHKLPNWAAKYFIDALLEKARLSV